MRVHRVWEVVVDEASARGKSLIRMIDEIDLEEDKSNFNSNLLNFLSLLLLSK